jgi:hypothetical protein
MSGVSVASEVSETPNQSWSRLENTSHSYMRYDLFIRLLVFAVVIFISSGLVYAQKSIRQVDFKNFNYPLSGPLLGHSELKWLGNPKDGYSNRKPIHLVNGDDLEKVSSFVMDGQEYSQFAGFTLQTVDFADVTGEGKEDAIIVLRYLTGGTQTTNYVYIYSFADGKPKLLAYCHTGSRADSGLSRVYGERGKLVFELSDLKKSIGDCCSSGFVRTRYQWQNGQFKVSGAHEYGPIEIEIHK